MKLINTVSSREVKTRSKVVREVFQEHDFSVTLYSAPSKSFSGLTRYATALLAALQALEVPPQFSLMATDLPGWLRPLSLAGALLGLDVTTFFQNYPVALPHNQAQIAHLTSENLASVLTWRKMSPVVVTVHGLFGYLLRNDPFLRTYSHGVEAWIDQRSVQGLCRADHLVCVSQYLANRLINELGISRQRISVIPEAVDHSTFYPGSVSSEFLHRYSLAPQKRYILYVGSEQPRKNFLMLLRAFAVIHRRWPDTCLLKVGRPEYSQERYKALALISELGLGHSVKFCGHVTTDLPDFYRIATAFVFPSLYEGFGFPPLEAQASGTPVVCSNTTSLPEVVGDAALLIDPYSLESLVDGLSRVLENESLAHQLIDRGLANAARFTWAQTAAETLFVYRKLVSE